MPRKTTKATRRACTRKVRHRSRANALAAAQSLRRRYGAIVHVYRCEVGKKGEPRLARRTRGEIPLTRIEGSPHWAALLGG